MAPLGVLLAFHIAAGVVALTTLGIPLITKKGAALHRRVGWVYVGAMSCVTVSALLLSAARLFNATPSDDITAYFLGQVGLLTGHNVYNGVRATRRRKAGGANLRNIDYTVTGVLLLSSLGTLGLAVGQHSLLLGGFSLLGLLAVTSEARFLWRGQHAPRAWFYRHLSSMIGSGIATITAVLVVNAPRLHLSTFNLAVWLGPALLGNLGIVAWTRYYRRRFSRPARQPASAASDTLFAGATGLAGGGLVADGVARTRRTLGRQVRLLGRELFDLTLRQHFVVLNL